MREDMINYKGAWLYPVDGGFEGNLYGFHYEAETLDDLKLKIDTAIKNNDIHNTLKLYSADSTYYSVMNEDEQGTLWYVVFQLKEPEIDDDMNDNLRKTVVIEAPDFDSAIKYAQQYLRKMQKESDSWVGAEILSIDEK